MKTRFDRPICTARLALNLASAWLLAILVLTGVGSAYAQNKHNGTAQHLANMLESTFQTQTGQVAAMVSDRFVRLSSATLKGEWLYHQRNTGAGGKVYEQRIIHLLPVDQHTVVQKTYVPNDLAKWANAWDAPEVLAGLSNDDFDASFDNVCDQRWQQQADDSWHGYVNPKTCKAFSNAQQRDIKMERELVLTLAKLQHAERGFDQNDRQLWGNEKGAFTQLKRVHSSSASLIEFSSAEDWRVPKAKNLMLLELENGEVLFELSPDFAPKHVKNIRKMVLEGYFDGSQVVRSQDNYVVQWGDPNAGTKLEKKLGRAKSKLPMEFFRDNKKISFVPIKSRDAYAAKTGFAAGFPVSSDGQKSWLTHCYGMLGVGRGNEADSGNGSSLYMVNGHAPRHLDRNVTLVGRAISGMGALSSLPRGTGPLGFFESEQQYITINKVTMGTQLPAAKLNLQILRTDTDTFKRYVELRTTRNEGWFLHPTGKIEVCNVSVPTRVIAK